MPLGQKISKAKLIGTIGALQQYTDGGKNLIKASQGRDVIINILLDYIDDADIPTAIWKTGIPILSKSMEQLVKDKA